MEPGPVRVQAVVRSASRGRSIPLCQPRLRIYWLPRPGWDSSRADDFRVEENLVICPESSLGKVSIYDNLGGRLRLFDPNMESDQAFSIQEYADIVGGFTAKKLEDVTNMTIETFYNTFIDPKPETCLETPANLWP